jgi:hypothetical protein
VNRTDEKSNKRKEQKDYSTTTSIIHLRLINILIKWLGSRGPLLDVAFGERLDFFPAW